MLKGKKLLDNIVNMIKLSKKKICPRRYYGSEIEFEFHPSYGSDFRHSGEVYKALAKTIDHDFGKWCIVLNYGPEASYIFNFEDVGDFVEFVNKYKLSVDMEYIDRIADEWNLDREKINRAIGILGTLKMV